MWKKLILVLAVCVLLPRLGNGQPNAALDDVVKAMGRCQIAAVCGERRIFLLGPECVSGSATATL